MIENYDENLLLAYVEGEASAEERARVDHMAEQDPALRRLLDELMQDRQRVRELPEEAPPPGLLDDALGGLERRMLLDPTAEPEPDAVEARFKIHRWLIYAGSMAAVFGCAAVLTLSLMQDDPLEKRANDLIMMHQEPRDSGADAEARNRADATTAETEQGAVLGRNETPDAAGTRDARVEPGRETLAAADEEPNETAEALDTIFDSVGLNQNPEIALGADSSEGEALGEPVVPTTTWAMADEAERGQDAVDALMISNNYNFVVATSDLGATNSDLMAWVEANGAAITVNPQATVSSSLYADQADAYGLIQPAPGSQLALLVVEPKQVESLLQTVQSRSGNRVNVDRAAGGSSTSQPESRALAAASTPQTPRDRGIERFVRVAAQGADAQAEQVQRTQALGMISMQAQPRSNAAPASQNTPNDVELGTFTHEETARIRDAKHLAWRQGQRQLLGEASPRVAVYFWIEPDSE